MRLRFNNTKNFPEILTVAEHSKNDTIISNVNKDACRLVNADLISIQDASGKLVEKKVFYPAMRDFLERAAGSYAVPTWNLANTTIKSANNERTISDKMMNLGKDLINEKIMHTSGMLQTHELDDQVQGVTSIHYQKVFDADILSLMGNEKDFMHGHIDSNISFFRYKIGELVDPCNLSWDIAIQLSNNEFGRRACSIGLAIVRQICTNGLVMTKFQESLKLRHYGQLKIEVMSKAVERLSTHIKDIKQLIEHALEEEIPTSNEEEFWKVIRSKFMFTWNDITSIKEKLKLEKPNVQKTMYGIGSAISAEANSRLGTDDYYKYQEIASQVFTMPVQSLITI